MNPKTFGKWIVQHPNADALDDNINLVSEPERKATNVAKYMGSSLLSQQKSFIAVTGFEKGTLIELDTQHLHKATNKTDSPSFSAILETANPAELQTLETSNCAQIRFKSSVLLTPFLVYKLIQEPDLSAENIFRILMKRILQREEQLFFEKKDKWKIAINTGEDNEDDEGVKPPTTRNQSRV